MGYLSCGAQSSISTCRSISAVAPSIKNRSKNSNDQIKEEEDDDDDDKPRKIEHFTYADLESATGNFSESSLLGRGSHGSVYRVTVASRTLAVKRPSPRPPSSTCNEVENEIEILSKIYSPRFVNLVGITLARGEAAQVQQRLLVLEFMPNGTLYDFLHTNPRPPYWSRRLRLALQTAKALLALHSACPPVIHRDVKSANVLIDRNFNARLGDFGLALRLEEDEDVLTMCSSGSCRGEDEDVLTMCSSGSCRQATPPAGTLGYLDPCYVTPDNLSTKTDVFSFGILLLEIMSGRKAIDVAHSPPSVVEWAVPLLRRGKVGAIYDPRIPPLKDSKVRRQLALLAASCVRSSDERRPSMEVVVEQLKVLSKALNALSRAWNGLSVVNPCSMVETEGTPLKLNNPRVVIKNAKLVDGEMPVDRKKLPLPVKAVRPSRNRKKKNLDVEDKQDKRNLMGLQSHPDGEIIEFCGRRSSVVSRTRTLRVTSDYSCEGGTMGLQNT